MAMTNHRLPSISDHLVSCSRRTSLPPSPSVLNLQIRYPLPSRDVLPLMLLFLLILVSARYPTSAFSYPPMPELVPRRLNPTCPDNSWVPSASHERCFKVFEFEDRVSKTAGAASPHEEVERIVMDTTSELWQPQRSGSSRRHAMGSWVEGMQMCVKQGGVLATLHTEQEDRIAHMLSDHIRGSCWIGLRRYLVKRPERGWIWVDSSSSLKDGDFMSWGGKLKALWNLVPPEEKCAEIDNDGWGELPCWGAHSKLHCAVCATEPVSRLENLPRQSYLKAFNPFNLWRPPSPSTEIPAPTYIPTFVDTSERVEGFWSSGPSPAPAMGSDSDLYWVQPESQISNSFFDHADEPPRRPPLDTIPDVFIVSDDEAPPRSFQSLVHVLGTGRPIPVGPDKSDMKLVKLVQSDVPALSLPTSPLPVPAFPLTSAVATPQETTVIPPVSPLPMPPLVPPDLSAEVSFENISLPVELYDGVDERDPEPAIAEATTSDAMRISITSLRGGAGGSQDAGVSTPEYPWDWINASPYGEQRPPPQGVATATAADGLPVRPHAVDTEEKAVEENSVEVEMEGSGVLSGNREGEYFVSRVDLQEAVQFRHWLPVVIAVALTLLGLLLCCAVVGLCCYRKACCCGGGALRQKEDADPRGEITTDNSETPTAGARSDISESDEERQSHEPEGTTSETNRGGTPFIQSCATPSIFATTNASLDIALNESFDTTPYISTRDDSILPQESEDAVWWFSTMDEPLMFPKEFAVSDAPSPDVIEESGRSIPLVCFDCRAVDRWLCYDDMGLMPTASIAGC
eukprot:GHVS01049236.1.p1 GENE.GHVS01049236.1~~GHVS01049236.1.p1  ORF type:complete len:799 (+),score=80.59 GHVS01049236.1:361-2757(+)